MAAITRFPEGLSNMLSSKKKLQLVAAFATLLLFALGVGCSGFFVDPVLTSITVGPTATINQGGTVQESAVGTYNDGSTKVLGSGVQWSSSATTTASVNSSGLVTGASPGTATITAAFQTTSGTSTVTVTITGLTAIQITPTTDTVTAPTTVQYTATGTVNGKQEDLTSLVTWSTSDTTGLVNIDSTGLATVNSVTGTPQTSVAITATEGTVTGTATLTVNAQ
jgi:Bacterial Ig-like domain (group 2)